MDDEKKIDIVLEEYKTLRNEIQSRAQNQFLSISVSTIAVGALIGIFLQNTINNSPGSFTWSYILLIITWVLTVFGTIWVDNVEAVIKIGMFIGEEIEKKKIPLLTEEKPEKLLTWQTSINEKYIKGDIPYIINFVALIYFILPSIIAIVAFIYYLFFYFAKQLSLLSLSLVISLAFIHSLLVIWLIYKWIQSLKKMSHK